MVRHEGIPVLRPSLRDGVHRADKQSGNTERDRALMAAQTSVAPGERRLGGVYQHVELDALLRVERRDFENVAVTHEPDRDVVIEVHRARGSGSDLLSLRT